MSKQANACCTCAGDKEALLSGAFIQLFRSSTKDALQLVCAQERFPPPIQQRLPDWHSNCAFLPVQQLRCLHWSSCASARVQMDHQQMDLNLSVRIGNFSRRSAEPEAIRPYGRNP